MVLRVFSNNTWLKHLNSLFALSQDFFLLVVENERSQKVLVKRLTLIRHLCPESTAGTKPPKTLKCAKATMKTLTPPKSMYIIKQQKQRNSLTFYVFPVTWSSHIIFVRFHWFVKNVKDLGWEGHSLFLIVLVLMIEFVNSGNLTIMISCSWKFEDICNGC